MTDGYRGELLETARYFRVDVKKLEASVKAEMPAAKKKSTKSPRKKRTGRKQKVARWSRYGVRSKNNSGGGSVSQ